MIKRGAGVLASVTSLFGEFGIGDFDAEEFLKGLAEMGFSWWQVLPLCPSGEGNSPYSGCSAFAGNYLLISPKLLCADGLLDDESLQESKYKQVCYKTDYEFAKWGKKLLLKKAYSLHENDLADALTQYAKKNDWAVDYAYFMTAKEVFESKAWWEWPREIKYRTDLSELKKNYAFLMGYYLFEQMVFDSQWQRLRQKAAEFGIKIMGDMPMYVSLDSADVWANPKYFQLNEQFKPIRVAGVPPDYFSADGQLWGNPLYDYGRMREDDFSWWRKRIMRASLQFDALRLDHFRAFYEYYSIEAGAENAKNGVWVKGPGEDLFQSIQPYLNGMELVAEDLGIIDDGVRDLLNTLQLPCMRVMQFAFEGDDNLHLPHNYPQNCVAYTATHDNNTTLGFLYETNEWVRKNALAYTRAFNGNWGEGGKYAPAVRAFIETLWQSAAALCVIPIQDMLGYGADCRLNIPGIAEGNWTYCLTKQAFEEIDKKYFKELNKIYKR